MTNAYTFSTKDIVHHADTYEQPMNNAYPVIRLVQTKRGISYEQALEACRTERRTKEEIEARTRFVAALTGLSPEQLEQYRQDGSQPGLLYTANIVIDVYGKYMADADEKHAIFGFIASLLTMGIAKRMLAKEGYNRISE